MPQKLAGMRIEPPPSLPVAMGHRYAATAAAAPPLDPPGVWSVFQGLRPGSPSRFSQVPTMPNSGTLVLPITTAPAAFTRSTTAESLSGIRSLNTSDPDVVRTPPVICVSLMGIGRPCNAPSLSPRTTAASASLAASIAWRRVRRRKELSFESSLSIRLKKSSASSTGETCLSEMSFRSSVAEEKASSSFIGGPHQRLLVAPDDLLGSSQGNPAMAEHRKKGVPRFVGARPGNKGAPVRDQAMACSGIGAPAV